MTTQLYKPMPANTTAHRLAYLWVYACLLSGPILAMSLGIAQWGPAFG